MGAAEPLHRLRQSLADRYRLERELGRGGMATVYLAHDLRHDRPIALKVLEPDLAAALGPERFQREIKVAARLQHPHILTVYDSGEVAPDAEGPRLLWFTMPYVEGESLRERLRRERQLSIDDAIRITREAAAGLDYAHRHGIVHRDVKPENVLLTSDGDVLVADFGIARALGGSDEALTQTGLAVGTPAYMSPEQAAGERELDPRTDVYSLGCVLYEMLAGEPPYTGPTAQAILAKRFHEPIPSVRRARPGVPETVDLAIQRALATVPADRFRTPAELAQALSPTTSSATTAALTPAATAVTTSGAAPRPVGRRRIPIGLATLGVGFLLGLGVLFAWRRSHRGIEDTGGSARLVVLPFENLGDSAQSYFADGVTDEIRTKLTGLPGVSVIARESAEQYRKAHKSLQQLGEELGVQYVLQGTIRWEKTGDGPGRVRVSPELVRVSDGTNVWAQRYDAVLSQVFEVQGQIAEAVASGLGVALSPHQQQELATRPTENLEAYDVYLRALAVPLEGYRERAMLLERATALDSSFVKAWAELATARLNGYWFGYDRTDQMLAAAKAAVDRALSLAPKDADSYAALGYYHYWGHRDYAKALSAFEQALAFHPADNAALRGIALVSRRLGRWDAAVEAFRRAIVGNPRDARIQIELGETLFLMRRYDEARLELDKAANIDPADQVSWIYRGAIRLALTGDFDAAREEFGRAPQETRTRSSSNFQTVSFLPFTVRFLGPEDQARLLQVPLGPLDADSATYYIVRAARYQNLGQPAVARAYFDSAAARLRRLLIQRPDDPEVHANLGAALAGLGRVQEGLQEARRATELMPFTRDQLANPGLVLVLTRIEVLAGRYDEAVAHLRALLSHPGAVSVGYLKASPEWAPLRSRADFQQLLGPPGS